MSNYIIAYHGGEEFEGPEEGAKHMAKWKAWVRGLGDAVVNPGTPLGKSKIICLAPPAGLRDASTDPGLLPPWP